MKFSCNPMNFDRYFLRSTCQFKDDVRDWNMNLIVIEDICSSLAWRKNHVFHPKNLWNICQTMKHQNMVDWLLIDQRYYVQFMIKVIPLLFFQSRKHTVSFRQADTMSKSSHILILSHTRLHWSLQRNNRLITFEKSVIGDKTRRRKKRRIEAIVLQGSICSSSSSFYDVFIALSAWCFLISIDLLFALVYLYGIAWPLSIRRTSIDDKSTTPLDTNESPTSRVMFILLKKNSRANYVQYDYEIDQIWRERENEVHQYFSYGWIHMPWTLMSGDGSLRTEIFWRQTWQGSFWKHWWIWTDARHIFLVSLEKYIILTPR